MHKERLSRAEKKLRREEKRNDPLGIDKMTDEEFLENLPLLQKKAKGNGILGALLFILGIILLVILWDTIF